LRRRDYRDAEPALFGGKIPGRKAASEAVNADAWPGEAGLQREPGVELADLQHCLMRADRKTPRTLLAARIEAGEARNESGQAGNHAHLAVARQHRRAFDRADQLYEAGETAAYRIGRRIVAVGAIFAEPGQRRDGEAGF